ncbi:MAG TPA: hypothetical protein VF541_06310, partial [Longimicrobium sp.]
SFVTLEFGPREEPAGGRGRPHGAWHLWIYCAAWRLDRQGDVLAASEDPRELLAEAVRVLEGLALVAVDVRAPALETTFAFENGVALHVFPIFSRDYEHWLLYLPDGQVLVAGPGSEWSVRTAGAGPAVPPEQPGS